MTFSSQSVAADMRDLIVRLADTRIETLRPAPRYAVVESIDTEARTCTAIYFGEATSVTVAFGSIQPSTPGQVIRVSGTSGDRYLDDVMGATTNLSYLPLAGGTMTGALTLSGAPTAALHAATKAYVDERVGNDVFTVNSQAAMLALSTATPGDFAIRTDQSKTYILTETDYSVLANWQEFVTPDATVAANAAVAAHVALADPHTQYVHKNGGSQILPTANSTVGLRVHAHATQAVDLFQTFDAATVKKFYITSAGVANGTFVGDGSGLTSLNGGQITTGTIHPDRIPVVNANTTGTAAAWTTARTLSLGGDLTGSALIKGDTDVTLVATIIANAITLGTDTTGNYVGGLAGTTNQVLVSGADGEGTSRTLSLPQSIHTAATPTFGRLILSQVTGTAPMTITSQTEVANLNSALLNGQPGSYYRDWTNATNKPDPIVTVSLTGPVAGEATTTWTDLSGNLSLSLATTIAGGPGSGINADLLDGQDGSFYQSSTNQIAGTLPSARLVGTYSHDLIGNVTGALTGNATTATTLQTTRTIAGFNFNGSANITFASHTAGSYLTGAAYNASTAVTWAVDATTTATASKVVARDASANINGALFTGTRFVSTQVTGTAPFTVASSTKVANLNADFLDGMDSLAFAWKEEVEALTGDLMHVGVYDAAAYTGEHLDLSYKGIAGQGISVPVTTLTDSSYDIRLDCTRPIIVGGLAQRPVSDGTNAFTLFEFSSTGVTVYFRNSASGWVPTTFTYASQTNFPAAGARLHLRFVWNKTTDARTLYWRPAAADTDLLSAVDWVQGATGTSAGMAVIAGARQVHFGAQVNLYYTGKLYRFVIDDDGVTNLLDLSVDSIPNTTSTSFTATSGQVITLPAGLLTTTMPRPSWSGGPTLYRHGMWWSVGSPGNLNFIDSDYSGFHDVNVDEPIRVTNSDWLIALDPLLGAVGHEVGTDQPLENMIFQWINNSAEIFVKDQIREHNEDPLAHQAAGFAMWADVLANFAPVVHNHDADIASALLLHEGASNPHPIYLTTTEANALYLPVGTNFNLDIQAAITAHKAEVDPHTGYINNARGDIRYEAKGAVTTHEAKADPHPQYLTTVEGDTRYDIAGAVGAHEAKADPHPQYTTAAEVATLAAPLVHIHDDRYYSKSEIGALLAGLEEDVIATDGAQSSRVFVGNIKPATAGIGDVLIEPSVPVNLQVPPVAANVSYQALSPTSIKVNWTAWPAASFITSVNLEWSVNGTTGWAPVAGSPLGAAVTTYTDTTVPAENTVRYYRLNAVNTAGIGPWSTVLVAQSANAAPPPPTGFTVGTKTASTIAVSWVAPTWADPGPSGARYEMLLNGASVGYASTTLTTYTFSGLTDNTQYQLGVRSKDAGGLVSTSVTLGPDATTGTPNAAPTGTPSGLTISIPTANLPSVQTVWTAPTLPSDFAYFQVELIKSVDSSLVQTVNTTNTNHTFANTLWATAMKFRVRLVDNLGAVGPWATSVGTATTMANPIPTALNVVVDKTDMTLSWTAPAILPEDFTQYRVFEYNGANPTPSWDYTTTSTSMFWNDYPYSTQRRFSVQVERAGSLTPGVSAITSTFTALADPIPTSPTASTVNLTTVRAAWGNPTVGEPNDSTNYRVRLKNSAGSVLSEQLIAYTATQSADFTGQAYSTTYKIDVRLERSNGQHSSYSAEASTTTGAHPDTTPPEPVTNVSWKPESAYRYMVFRFTTPGDCAWADVYYNINGAGWNLHWSGAMGGGAQQLNIGYIGSAGQTVYALVHIRDAMNNWRYGDAYSYYLLNEWTEIWPTQGGTWRNGAWRNDGTRSLNEIAQGRTSTGENYGCYFYGTQFSDNFSGRDIQEAYIEYWRVDEGGAGEGVTPYFWLHGLTSRDAGGLGVWDAGVVEGSRAGLKVARNYSSGFGDTSGYWYMPAAFYNQLKSGAARGLTMYKYTTSTNPDYKESFYMLLADPSGVGGVPQRRNGRVMVRTWG